MSAPKLRCPACGEKVFLSDQQCLACGAKLDEGQLVDGEPSDRAAAEVHHPAAAGYEISNAGAAAWDPSLLAAGGGIMAALRRGWVFLKQAVLLVFRDKDLLLPSFFSLLANLVLVGLLIWLLHLTGNLKPLWEGNTDQLSAAAWVLLLGFAFVGYVVTFFFTGMTVHLVDVVVCGRDARLKAAFVDSVRNIGGILMLAVVTQIVNLLTSALRGKSRGGMRRAAADVAEAAWRTAAYLILPIIMLEDKPFIDAVNRATALHRSNVVQIVVGELGLLLTTRLFSDLVIFVGIACAAASYFLAPQLLWLGLAVAIALLLLSMTFAAYVRTAFYTCMYLWAVAIETAGEMVAAPAPLRPALHVA